MTPILDFTMSATMLILFETRFSDPDGDPLTFSFTSSDESILTVTESESFPGHLQLTKIGTGVVLVSITASDGKGGTAINRFTVTVD